MDDGNYREMARRDLTTDVLSTKSRGENAEANEPDNADEHGS
jgi:hypothetical protein